MAAGAEHSVAAACLLGENQGPDIYRRGVLLLALGFFGVFGGFQAAQGLQTSVNATLGYINLACLYSTFTVLCLAAPRLLAYLEGATGLRAVMVVSAFTYALMALSNIWTGNWALPISMNVVVGMAAPLLWTCQNDYVGRCAYQAAISDSSTGDGSQAFESLLNKRTSEFNGLFFSIYQFSGGTGNVLASCLMLAFADKAWLKTMLFVVLSVISSLGAVFFAQLPPVQRAGQEAPSASLQATLALVFGDRRMALMVPLIFTNGMLLSCAFGNYATDVICPVLGANFVGFVIATFFAVNSVASLVWSSVVKHDMISRRTAYFVSGLLQLGFLAAKFTWQRPDNYENNDGKWEKAETPELLDGIIVFALIALFAVGDAFWESGPPGTLQSFFASSPDAVPAMANLKMWQSLGFAIQFALGATLPNMHEVRDGILAALAVLSLLSVVALSRVAPLK
eukprot:TRINITY_DN52972_c0_g1_i1.p1 TRINITY_DN52972_c0_g1~~TRINITY_DN52972_c0_g1_i1.p1  ORF type:complete len:453 (-),score=80.08 TRINITY_DN52972_c0_g1_i1:114-1472(-)